MGVSTYTAEKAQAIVDALCEGTPLAQVCREIGVGLRTAYDWMDADKDFAARIARAREVGEEVIAASCLDIADDGRRDYVANDDGVPVVDHDHIQRSKLRIDTRFKLLAKWNPKKWAERQVLAGDANNPLTFTGKLETIDDATLAAIALAGGRGASSTPEG